MALGMALSCPDTVVALDGDGSLLMNLGTLASIGRENPENLIIIVWDNEEWGQTGHQASHTAFGTSLDQVASACGIKNTARVDSEDELEEAFCHALEAPGPWLILAKIKETEHLPYAPIEPEITLHRFRSTFEQSQNNPLTKPWMNSSKTA
jgi:sulfopyruvate decarboxylase subunit beta